MKIKSIFFISVVIVMLIFQLLTVSGPIYADEVTSLITFTDATFRAYISGVTPRVEVPDYNNIPQNADIKIAYAFNVDDTVTAGDYFTITLPPQLTSIATLPVVNETLSVISGGFTYDIATLSIPSGGIATITFLPGIDSLSEVSASFSIEGSLNEGSIHTGDTVSFSLVAGGTFYNIGFVPDPLPPTTTATIAKSGTYNPLTNEITWTVSVNSGGVGITINDVHVVDTLGANQAYIADSTSPNPPISEPTLDAGTGKYTFSLGDVTGTTSFTYKTTPTAGAFGAEGSTSTLTNTADLFIGPVTGDPVKTANASVTVTTDWTQKSGVLRTAGGIDYIDWTITLNNNNRTIPAGSTITDTLPQYLVGDGLSVRRNGALPSTFDDGSTFIGQVFTYTFNAAGSDVAGQQVITFTTSVDPDYYKQQNTTGFANTGTLNIGGIGYGATSGIVGVPTSLLAKSGDGYDASTQLITWKMEVNNNGQTIGDATITDTFGANQEFWFDYGIIRVDTGGPVSLTNIADGGIFTAPNQYYYNSIFARIYLGDLTAADNPIIRFQTKVINSADYADNKTTNYYNTATLVGAGITNSTSTGTQQVQSLVLAKTKATGEGTDYNYTTRVLSWRITVNQNEMVMPAAVVTDTIPAGQAYVNDSLLIDGSGPGPGVLNIAGNILTITLGNISTEKVLTFKTVVTDLSVFLSTKGNINFINDATLTSGIIGAPVVNVTATQPVNNTALSKSILTDYIPANSYIEWKVYINSNQAPMQNAFLSDTLQSGLELNVGSIVLYLWNQASDGTMTIGAIVPPGSYSFEYDYVTRIFHINLPDGAQGYYLKFKTDVLAPGRYSNDITLNGESNISDNVSSSVTISNSDFEAGASGTNGSITITKVDGNGNPITTGAVFELLDSLHNLKKTLTTGVDGKAIFDKLKFRTYYIREKTPPTGYQLSSEEIMVTLTNNPPEKQYQIVTFRNSLLTASISLKKNKEDGAGLAGGRFSIYYASDTSFANPLQTVISAENGLIIFSGLNAGSYKIREVEPPSGYYITSEVRSANLVLDVQNNSMADVTVAEPFVNKRVPLVKFGKIQLLKVDKKNNPLSGASFGLYDSKGKLIQTTISATNGLVLFQEVPFGTYTIRELAAPIGYKLSDIKASCTVSSSDTISRANPYAIINLTGSGGNLGILARTGIDPNIPIAGGSAIIAGLAMLLITSRRRVNTRIPSKLRFIKIDSVTGKPVPGATCNIYNNSSKHVEIITTGPDGWADVTLQNWRTYTVKGR